MDIGGPCKIGWLLFANVAGLLVWASVGTAQAQIIIQHSGNADPTTEGWTRDLGIGVTERPVTGDLGFDAWSIDDSTTAADSTRLYTFVPSAAVVSAALTYGWRLTARLRVVDAPENVDRATMVEFIDGTTRWRMDFGSQPDGDPVVLLQMGVSGVGNDTGVLFALEGGGSGYHLYAVAILAPERSTFLSTGSSVSAISSVC